MEWQVVVVMMIVIPVILFPVAFIWYMNIGGIYAVFNRVRERRVVRKKGVRDVVEAK